MFNLLLVSLGGGLGAVSRFLLGAKIQHRYPDPPFPVAMLTVNLLGSLGLGIFFGAFFGGIPIYEYNNPWFLLLGVGYFGAFTTFSTFSVEAVTLLHDAKYKKAFLYIVLSIAGSVAAFIAGIYWFI
ncbi:fluoride efflux transporter CrcB [Bacillus sp. H-16]|uniref:fluoride efflux transporter CrcB n=1 Tax=Alteribacter salitolerans TaxID=2912333 RepID=UPI0019669B08|nr:fluoride efflux transporter CrcB [Alteribacter salitolerans]MBM7097577.1 fluoride efflux transporter CrcB [Alteribacter salitolerans]